MKILVSACLLGENCKYNGGNNFSLPVTEYLRGREVIPVCPERMAGLGIPRTPIEIVDGVLTDRDGKVVDGLLREAVANLVAELKKEKSTALSCSPEVKPAVSTRCTTVHCPGS